MRQYYKNNPEKYNKHKDVYVKNNDNIWTAKVDAYIAQKIVTGCMDCGEKDPVVMELDHRNSKEKKYTISSLRRIKVPIEELIEELDKCDTVCVNCHRRRTAKEFGSWRLDLPL